MALGTGCRGPGSLVGHAFNKVLFSESLKNVPEDGVEVAAVASIAAAWPLPGRCLGGAWPTHVLPASVSVAKSPEWRVPNVVIQLAMSHQ